MKCVGSLNGFPQDLGPHIQELSIRGMQSDWTYVLMMFSVCNCVHVEFVVSTSNTCRH